jgi:hypothetical protein
MFHKLEEWARTHRAMAIVSGIALLIVLLLVYKTLSAPSGAQQAAMAAEQLSAQKLQGKDTVEVAKLQAQASEEPSKQQTAQASIAADAEKALGLDQANTQQLSIADSLSDALASITGSVTMNQSDNNANVAIDQSNNTAATTQDGYAAWVQTTLGSLASTTATTEAWDAILGIKDQDQTAVTIDNQNNTTTDYANSLNLQSILAAITGQTTQTELNDASNVAQSSTYIDPYGYSMSNDNGVQAFEEELQKLGL